MAAMGILLLVSEAPNAIGPREVVSVRVFKEKEGVIFMLSEFLLFDMI